MSFVFVWILFYLFYLFIFFLFFCGGGGGGEIFSDCHLSFKIYNVYCDVVNVQPRFNSSETIK